MPVIENIYRYPLKSCKEEELTSCEIVEKGLKWDRNWALFDSDGQVVTGRTHPFLLDIEISVQEKNVAVILNNSTQIEFDIEPSSSVAQDRNVFSYDVKGMTVSQEANKWFSEYLNKNVELLYTSNLSRPVLAKHGGKENDIVSFADQAPILLVSKESLNDLNSRLHEPIQMNRFRPNLIVSGCEAYEEDSWKYIKIGSCEFEIIQRCERCIFTTIDPLTKVKDANKEPLKTLSTYRKMERGGVNFGVHLVPRKLGIVKRGDAVEQL